MTKDEEIAALREEVHRVRMESGILERDLNAYKAALEALRTKYCALAAEFCPNSLNSVYVGGELATRYTVEKQK